MLIESSIIRDLFKANINVSACEATQDDSQDFVCQTQEENNDPPPPENQPSISLNPIPALVIMVLGIMMSSHQQDSMISSMLHKQWGNLLMVGAFARMLTYVLVYLKPPCSVLWSRPPTELLASFGLMSGGMILMASVSFRS